MCGIALVAGHGPSGIAFGKMLDALSPRGETEQVAAYARLLAGTHRLRIVDPAGGAQPLTSPDGRWLLCYNGEIFNHRWLRDELRGLGHGFRTGGDTEVVLAAVARWGEAAVRRFRGEFAVAVADLAAER